MKKRTIAALMTALLLTLSACGAPKAPAADDDTLHVLATTYPVYLFTTAVTQGVDGVEVSLLINQQTSCLHDYTLTTNDMKAIEGADVIVKSGAGLEDFMDDALAQSKADVIDCSTDIDLLPTPEHAGHDGHDHEEEYDPHIWMSTPTATVMLNNILHGLNRLDKAHTDAYTANFQAAVDLLPENPLENNTLAHPNLITFHDGFQYFALDSDLTILKSIEEEEGSEASASDIKEIVALIKEYDLPAIFTERNGSTATADAIARETGVKVYQLDMIMSGDGTGIQPYVDAMNKNYETVLEALK